MTDVPPRFAPWSPDHVMTAFQAAVVAAVERLGPGDLATYREIAEEIGHPGAAQAVANVLRCAPDLPWWRVLPSNERLYRSHAPTQIPLLVAEGHRVVDRRVVAEHGG